MTPSDSIWPPAPQPQQQPLLPAWLLGLLLRLALMAAAFGVAVAWPT